MLIKESEMIDFLDKHLSPTSFDIDVGEGEFYEKRTTNREGNYTVPNIEIYPRKSEEDYPTLGDCFRGHEDTDFPIRYIERVDIDSIEDIDRVNWISLSRGSDVYFKRMNNDFFNIEVNKLTINSFKELVQYAKNKEDIYALLSYL